MIERRYAKCSSQIDKKPSCCKYCKIFIITLFCRVFSPLSHCFNSAGIVTPPKGENRPQRKSESLDEYLGRFKHTVVICRFAIFDWSFVTLIFPEADGCCSAHGLPSPPPPSFSFLCQMLKFEGSLGKFV